MDEKPIPVRTALMPLYYKDFHCIMGACQDNCCDDGWKIEFNKKDYLTIKRAVQGEELKELMSQSLCRLREKEHDGMYAEFRASEENRCAFHTPEGLCRLQMECGAEALPAVCQFYPRRKVYSAAGLEYSLSPSCEGVLELLWNLPEGVDFLEEPLARADWKTLRPTSPAAARFADIRSLMIDALQERSLPLPQRMLLLGLLVQRLQRLDWAQEGVFDSWLQWARGTLSAPAAAQALRQMPRNRNMFINNNIYTLLQAMKAEGRTVINGEGKDIFSIDAARYEAQEARLEELLGHSEHFFENLMVAVAFYISFPTLRTPEELWKSYVNLCNIYSVYRFSAVCAMGRGENRASLFHVLVQISRILLHSSIRQSALRDEFFQNESATLAHMAILLDG